MMSTSVYNLNQQGMFGMPEDGPQLWNNTLGYGFVGPRSNFMSWQQQCRAERIRAARLLWKGQHRWFYLWEGRSQWNFPPMSAQGRELVPYLTYNLLRLVTLTKADLLMSVPPQFKVGDDADGAAIGIKGTGSQADLDALVKRSQLHRVYYDAVKEASWADSCTVEVTTWGRPGKPREVYVTSLPPGEVYPAGPCNPDGQYDAYIRFAMDREVPTDGGKPRQLLLETTYGPGTISRKCYILNGTQKSSDASLDLWPHKGPDGKALPELERTGLDCPSIVYMPNELDEGNPTCDYDGLIEFQDAINAKQTQIARVLAKHSDPKLAVSMAQLQTASQMGGSMISSYDVFAFETKDQVPQYITWNAELAAAMADRDQAVMSLCAAAEMSPVLLGIRQGATPDAARKLRLEATKSLSRAARTALFVAPFVCRANDVAMQLINSGRAVIVPMGGCSASLSDGLPQDDLDQAQTLSLLTGGKAVMSVDRAVEIQIPDPEAAAAEIARLKDAAASATPSILFGGAAQGGAAQGGDGADGVDGTRSAGAPGATDAPVGHPAPGDKEAA